MSKEIDKLIEQVLKERTGRINWDDVEGNGFRISKAKEPSADDVQRYLFGYTDVEKGTRAINKDLQATIKELAKQWKEGDNYELEKQDLIAYLETNTAEEIKNILNRARWLGTGSKYAEFKNELYPRLDIWERETDRYQREVAKVQDRTILQKIKQDDPTGFKQQTGGFELGTFPSTIAGMESSQKDYKDVNIADMKPDPMLFKVFKSIDGETVIEKFVNLQVFADYIMKGNLDGWFKNVLRVPEGTEPTPEQEFTAINYSMVLTLLGDASKTGDSSNAGAFFEGFLGYLISAPSVGKAGMAADNIAKLIHSDKVLKLSAKFYLSKTSCEQSSWGLYEDTKSDSVYYLSVIKGLSKDLKGQGLKDLANDSLKASGGEFDILHLYLTRYYQVDGNLYGVGLDDNAVDVPKTKQLLLNTVPTKGDKTKVKLFAGNIDSAPPILTFPVISPKTYDNFDEAKAAIASQTATSLAKHLYNTGETRMKSFVQIINNLKQLDYETKQYSGDKANKAFEKSPQKAVAAIKTIYNKYDSLNTSYTSLFTDVEDRTEFKTTNESLDRIIESIIKQKLLK